MLKADFLKSVGLLGSAGALALVRDATPASAASEEADPLVGLWEMTVVGDSGTYRYIYSISPGAWTGTGNIDEGFQGFKYSPSMGAYALMTDGSYRYAERGWTFDQRGNNVGTFRSVGTFKLDATKKIFSGPGTFTQLDSKGKTLFVEHFKATATKADV
jgi:hypothetical protein